MAQVSRSYPRQPDLTYVHVWNGSGTIESSIEMDYLEP